MYQPDLVPPHRIYESNFVTTERNLLFHWLANFIIVPIYFVSIVMLAQGIIQSDEPLLLAVHPTVRIAAAAIICILALLQVIASVLAPAYWHTGISGREFPIILSVFLFAIWNHPSQTLVFETLHWVLAVAVIAWLGMGLIRLIVTVPPLVRYFTVAILLLVGAGSVYVFSDTGALSGGVSSLVRWSGWWILWVVVAIPITIHAGVNLHRWRLANMGTPEYLGALIAVDSLGLALAALVVLNMQRPVSDLIASGVLGLSILYLSANPRLFLSKHIAYIRYLTRPLRHDAFVTRLSYLVESRNPFRRLIREPLSRLLAPGNRLFYSLVCVALGMVVSPVLFNLSSPNETFLIGPEGVQALMRTSGYQAFELLNIGIASTAILLTIYWTVWLVQNRFRYIATEFAAYSSKSTGDVTPEVRAVAKLVTSLLVEELQRIAALLQSRQIERLDTDRNDTRVFFVTSGSDEAFLEQFRDVVTLDTSGNRYSFGSILKAASRYLARIRLSGQVRERSNGTVELWAEMQYLNRRTFSVGVVLAPEAPIEHIDEVVLRPVIRELALRLTVESSLAPYLGSTWETLDYFLEGLEAASRRDWSLAITKYREAIQRESKEETVRTGFGIGHFHLGAALYYQGDTAEGIDEINLAEQLGPPMADVHYMQALILLYRYWSELHKYPKILEIIVGHCNEAIHLRSTFAEAYQLRGTARYRAARQIDRNVSKVGSGSLDSGNKQVPADKQGAERPFDTFREYRQARYLYGRAVRDFTHSIGAYDRAARRLRGKALEGDDFEIQVMQILERRMTVAHQMADALRSVGRYVEADSYYEDVAVAFPRNARNIASRAKNYVMANNWQRAEEYIKRDAMRFDHVAWDAEIHMHLAWATLGGVLEERRSSTLYLVGILLRVLMNRPRLHSGPRFSTLSISATANLQPLDKRRDVILVSESLKSLDFALYLRPKFADAWRQSDWFTAFMESTSSEGKVDCAAICKSPLIDTTGYVRPELLSLWIQLRLRLLGTENGSRQNEPDTLDSLLARLCADDQASAIQVQLSLMHELAKLRREAAELDESDLGHLGEGRSLVNSPLHRLRQAKFARNLLAKWNENSNSVDDLTRIEDEVTFRERWLVDLFLELTLLTCRTLAELQDFEELEKTAKNTFNSVQGWIRNRWNVKSKRPRSDQKNAYSDDALNIHTFSPLVSTYQRITIRLWELYAKYFKAVDPLTRSRRLIDKKAGVESSPVEPDRDVTSKEKTEAVLDEIQLDLTSVRAQLPYHPLLLYLQAHIYKDVGLASQATEELEHLLGIILPFEPNRDVAESSLVEPTLRMDHTKADPGLFRFEKVAGRRQFGNIISRVSVNQLLAEIQLDAGKPDLSIRYLVESVRWSPHVDVTVDNLLRLANQLVDVDRYEDAAAIVASTRAPIQKLRVQHMSETKRDAPNIIMASINARSLRFEKAVIEAKKVAHLFTITSLAALQNEQTDVANQYDSRTQRTVSEKPREDMANPSEVQGKFSAETGSAHVVDMDQLDNRGPDHRLLSKYIQQIENVLNRLVDPSTNGLQMLVGELNGGLKGWRSELKEIIDVDVRSQSFAQVMNRVMNKARPGHESPLPEVFVILADEWKSDKDKFSRKLDTIAALALCAINQHAMSRLIERLDEESESLYAVARSHLLMRLAKQARNTLLQIADLCNTLAYSRSEQGSFGDSYPEIDSTTAVTITSFLTHFVDRDTKYHRQYSRLMAQYLDTLAWVKYRRTMQRIRLLESDSSPRGFVYKELEAAERILDRAVRLDPTTAIIHHHLSILHLTRVEFKWLEINRQGEKRSESDAAIVDTNLKQSLRSWHNARRHDTSGRLHKRLARQYHRLMEFTRAWDIDKLGRHNAPGRPD